MAYSSRFSISGILRSSELCDAVTVGISVPARHSAEHKTREHSHQSNSAMRGTRTLVVSLTLLEDLLNLLEMVDVVSGNHSHHMVHAFVASFLVDTVVVPQLAGYSL